MRKNLMIRNLVSYTNFIEKNWGLVGKKLQVSSVKSALFLCVMIIHLFFLMIFFWAKSISSPNYRGNGGGHHFFSFLFFFFEASEWGSWNVLDIRWCLHQFGTSYMPLFFIIFLAVYDLVASWRPLPNLLGFRLL